MESRHPNTTRAVGGDFISRHSDISKINKRDEGFVSPGLSGRQGKILIEAKSFTSLNDELLFFFFPQVKRPHDFFFSSFLLNTSCTTATEIKM